MNSDLIFKKNKIVSYIFDIVLLVQKKDKIHNYDNDNNL